jgi:hypothetical protein
LEVSPKALYFIQPRSEKFWNCGQKHCIVQPRSEKNLNCGQKHCILFSRTEKILEVRPKALYFANKSTVFCSNCEQKRCILFSCTANTFWNCDQKHSLVQPRRANFGIATKSTIQPRRENFCNCDQKHCILFSRPSEIFWNCEQKSCTLFSRAEKSVRIAIKARILFSRAAKRF